MPKKDGPTATKVGSIAYCISLLCGSMKYKEKRMHYIQRFIAYYCIVHTDIFVMFVINTNIFLMNY